MKLLLILLSSMAMAADAPKPKALDLSKVSRADIIKTVKHLQQLTNDSIAKADALEKKLVSADEKAVQVQVQFDAERERRIKSEKAEAVQRARAWKWTLIACITWVLVAGFFVLRSFFPFLKAI